MLPTEQIRHVFKFSVYHLVLTAMIILLFNPSWETTLERWNSKNKKKQLN